MIILGSYAQLLKFAFTPHLFTLISSMPRIGIIGTQNVGKSTLFNSLLRKNRSITYDMPGVTRDMVTIETDWGEGRWELTDFPGFENEKNLREDILGQKAIESSMKQLSKFSLLLWVVSRKGLSPFEQEMVDQLRVLQKPVWLVVNFVDDPSLEAEASEFYSLGFDRVFFISALNNRNIPLLRNDIIEHFSRSIRKKDAGLAHAENESSQEVASDDLEDDGEGSDEPVGSGSLNVRITLAGKPNAGKSTFFNTLLSKERSLVSDIPGTTRDAIEEVVPFREHRLVFLDTAGLRKKRTIHESVEFFSVTRTHKAIKSSDLTLVLINAREGVDRQNRSILDMIRSENKPMIVLVTHADTLTDDQRKEFEQDIKGYQKNFWKFPYHFIDARTPAKVTSILEQLIKLYLLAQKRFTTSSLNQILKEVNQNPIMRSHSISFNYITYAMPERKFIVFGNKSARAVGDNIRRYMESSLQKKLGQEMIPIRIEFRRK